jgi:hypothetical protein
MPKGPSRQISFRVDKELAKKIEEAAVFEELALADFARKLFKRAFQEYETAGSLHALRAKDGDAPARRKKAS